MNRRGALPRVFPWLTGMVGLIIAAPAAMHIVAVIDVAYRERGGYDVRLADLLWIGWTSLVCGLLMVAAVPALLRGSTVALRTAAGAAAVFGFGTVLVAPVSPGFLAGLPIFGCYLLVAAVVHIQQRAADRVRPDRPQSTDAPVTR